MKEPRRATVSAPPSRRGRRSRKRAPDPGPAGYNLYTKINAFSFFETLNRRIVQNVTLFVPYTEISFCLFVCTKYVSLCAQHSSRPFTDRSSVTFSPSLLYSPSDVIFEMHSQSSSAAIFALALTEPQNHAERLGSPILPSVVEASLL